MDQKKEGPHGAKAGVVHSDDLFVGNKKVGDRGHRVGLESVWGNVPAIGWSYCKLPHKRVLMQNEGLPK